MIWRYANSSVLWILSRPSTACVLIGILEWERDAWIRETWIRRGPTAKRWPGTRCWNSCQSCRKCYGRSQDWGKSHNSLTYLLSSSLQNIWALFQLDDLGLRMVPVGKLFDSHAKISREMYVCVFANCCRMLTFKFFLNTRRVWRRKSLVLGCFEEEEIPLRFVLDCVFVVDTMERRDWTKRFLNSSKSFHCAMTE